MAEIIQKERILPHNFDIVPGMEDVHDLMTGYGWSAADHWLAQHQLGSNTPPIIVPLNGGIVPLIYTRHTVLSLYRDSVPDFMKSVVFTDNDQTGRLTFSGEVPLNRPWLVLDDIVDQADTITNLAALNSSLSLFAPVQKPHTHNAMRKLPDTVSVRTEKEIPNEWVWSGAGMNRKRLPVAGDVSAQDQAYISAMQRLGGIGTTRNVDKWGEPDFETQRIFFSTHMLAWAKQSPLLQMLTNLDLAKIEGKLDTQFQLATLLQKQLTDPKQVYFLN